MRSLVPTQLLLATALSALPLLAAPADPVVLPAPPYRYTSNVPAGPLTQVRLTETAHKLNRITDTDKWLRDNQLSLASVDVANPAHPAAASFPAAVPARYTNNILMRLIRNGDYWLAFYGADYADARYLIAYAVTDFHVLWALDFKNYLMPPEVVPADRDFVTESPHWAAVENGILYVSNFHTTYARSSLGMNAYITAIDLRDKHLLWRSQPRIGNSTEFAIVNDAILSAYGFTSERDFLYVLDKRTGAVAQTVPIAKMASHIVVKDGAVYVRTYNTDYTFKVANQ